MNISIFALLLSAFFLSSTRMDPPPSTSTTTSSSKFSSSIVVHALSQSIVVVGLNAALQKRFVLLPGDDLEPGNVHRASKCDTGVGGKGQDVGVALSCLMNMTTKKEEGGGLLDTDIIDGRPGRVILAQFLGMGAEGDAVSIALTSKYGLRDESLTVRNAAPLRTCTTIVGANCATELVETSGEVTSDEMSMLYDGIDELTSEAGGGGRGRGRGRRADCVCVMGSMPPGCPEDAYADLVRRLADSGSLVLVDSVIGLGPLLKTLKSIFDNDENDNDENDGDGDDSSNAAKGDGGGGGGGAVLKLNAAELCKLGGVVKTSGESCRVSHDELSSSARGFVSRYDDAVGALEYLCVTDGKFPGYVVEIPRSGSSSSSSSSAGSFRTWRLPPVDLSDRGTLYPIGAGDTVSAGTLAAMQHLRRSRGGRRVVGSDRGRVVVPPDVGGLLSEKCAEWAMIGSGRDDDAGGCGMAAAFAFGLACGSASCLREDNSVFDVDDAIAFFGGMAKPIYMPIPAMDPVAS